MQAGDPKIPSDAEVCRTADEWEKKKLSKGKRRPCAKERDETQEI